MTDPSKFQAHWKTPFFFNPHDKIASSDIQQYFTSPQATDTSSSARSSPLHSPLPHLPSSPHHHHLRQTNSCASFQPFDPFDTDSALDDSTTLTNKDAELDKLSTLLSRQFLDDVDAETVPSSSPAINTTKTTTSSTISTPNTRMLGSFTHTVSSPWTLDDSASLKQPWSPVLNSSGLLPSPTTKDSNNTPATTTQWDRFEPYGNDSEFDPTLPFYQGDGHHHPTRINQHPLGSTPTSKHNGSNIITEGQAFGINSNMGQENQLENFNMTTVALQKLSLLFPDHDEKELEQTLAALDYDVERTIEALTPKSTSTTQSNIPPAPTLAATSISNVPLTATAEKVHVIKSSAITTTTTTTTTTSTSINTNNTNNNEQQPSAIAPTGTVRKRQVCRHYLAGECYRKDCWFAHDLEVKPCKFWLQGLCLKGDTCEFAHSLEELEQVAKTHHHQQQQPSSLSSSSYNNNKSTPIPNSHYQQYHHNQEQQQQQPYTSPTVADFPILLARSKRKSKKKSQNKKIKT